MAGRGPAPKDPATRRRRNITPPPTVLPAVADDVYGPDLPAGYDWPTQTKRWWDTWRTCPQAMTLTDTDWDFLLDTALLHAELWSGNGQVASELRLRVAKFGATPEDRMRLRLQIGEPVKPEQTQTQSRSRYAHLRVVAQPPSA
jgi:hypothetical protein